MNGQSCFYSQWFTGDDNSVSDLLTHDFHVPSPMLTNLIASSVPQQVPFGLQILPLPTEISFWLICLLPSQPQKEQWSKVP